MHKGFQLFLFRIKINQNGGKFDGPSNVLILSVLLTPIILLTDPHYFVLTDPRYFALTFTDDDEHEWIVRTCRKGWDEIVGYKPKIEA